MGSLCERTCPATGAGARPTPSMIEAIEFRFTAVGQHGTIGPALKLRESKRDDDPASATRRGSSSPLENCERAISDENAEANPGRAGFQAQIYRHVGARGLDRAGNLAAVDLYGWDNQQALTAVGDSPIHARRTT